VKIGTLPTVLKEISPKMIAARLLLGSVTVEQRTYAGPILPGDCPFGPSQLSRQA
jgi:hypothetical protein